MDDASKQAKQSIGSRIASNGTLLAVYCLLFAFARFLFTHVDAWKDHLLRTAVGGWVHWYIGLLYTTNPCLIGVNDWALLVNHLLFFTLYAYGTSRLKRFWLPAALLVPISWLFGYAIVFLLAGPSFLSQFLHGHYYGF